MVFMSYFTRICLLLYHINWIAFIDQIIYCVFYHPAAFVYNHVVWCNALSLPVDIVFFTNVYDFSLRYCFSTVSSPVLFQSQLV